MKKNTKKTPKRLHLALQGGGAHGAFSWGVLDYLLEECQQGNLEIGNISGTSAGAMNAAVLADGLLKGGPTQARENLRHFWMEIGKSAEQIPIDMPMFRDLHSSARFLEFFSPINLKPLVKYWNDVAVATWVGFSNFNRAWASKVPAMFSPYDLNFDTRDVLRDKLNAQIDFKALRNQTDRKIYISATEVETGAPKHFTGAEITADTLIASACLPEIFKAVEIDNKHYWDGGYSANPTLLPLLYEEKEHKDLMVVQLSPVERSGVPRTANDIQERAKEIGFTAPFQKALRQVELLNSLFEASSEDPSDFPISKINLHVIGDKNHLAGYSSESKSDPSTAFFEELFLSGRKAAKAWMKANHHKIGVESSYQSIPDKNLSKREKLAQLILRDPPPPMP